MNTSCACLFCRECAVLLPSLLEAARAFDLSLQEAIDRMHQETLAEPESLRPVRWEGFVNGRQ